MLIKRHYIQMVIRDIMGKIVTLFVIS